VNAFGCTEIQTGGVIISLTGHDQLSDTRSGPYLSLSHFLLHSPHRVRVSRHRRDAPWPALVPASDQGPRGKFVSHSDWDRGYQIKGHPYRSPVNWNSEGRKRKTAINCGVKNEERKGGLGRDAVTKYGEHDGTEKRRSSVRGKIRAIAPPKEKL